MKSFSLLSSSYSTVIVATAILSCLSVFSFQPPLAAPSSTFRTWHRSSLATTTAGVNDKHDRHSNSRTTTLALAAANKDSRSNSNSNPTETADFEFQELRAQLNAMKQAGLASRDLDATKRQELEGYVRQVALKRPSPIPLSDIADELPNTTWRLAFSTEAATLGDLPRDATVYLKFYNNNNDNSNTNQMDYILQFGSRTFGLNNIKAKSTWNLNDSTGLLTFAYDKITTDAFGLKNIGVGFFGLLKGRANYVETAFFDGTYWIERGLGPTGDDEFLNVYVRED